MSNLTKPQRLSPERLDTIRLMSRERYLVNQYRSGWVNGLLSHIAALDAELDERTRERDEALLKIREAAQDGDMHPYLKALLWEAVGILSPGIDPGNGPKKGPADDR